MALYTPRIVRQWNRRLARFEWGVFNPPPSRGFGMTPLHEHIQAWVKAIRYCTQLNDKIGAQ